MYHFFSIQGSEDYILPVHAFTEAMGMWPSGVRECMNFQTVWNQDRRENERECMNWRECNEGSLKNKYMKKACECGNSSEREDLLSFKVMHQAQLYENRKLVFITTPSASRS